MTSNDDSVIMKNRFRSCIPKCSLSTIIFNIAILGFVIYMCQSLFRLLKVAVPDIPYEKDESEGLPSYWKQAESLELYLSLSTNPFESGYAQHIQYTQPSDTSFTILKITNLTFGWDINVDFELNMEFIYSANSSSPQGLQFSCIRDDSGLLNPYCLEAAREWTTINGQSEIIESSKGGKLGRRIMTNGLLYSVYSLFSNSAYSTDEDGFEGRKAIVFSSKDTAAKSVARALVTGSGVSLFSNLVWTGISPDGYAGSPIGLKSPKKYSQGFRPHEVPKGARSGARMVVPEIPHSSKCTRFIWTDMLSPQYHDAVAQFLGLPSNSLIDSDSGYRHCVEIRENEKAAHLERINSHSSSSIPSPSLDAHVEPHFVSLVDMRLVMDTLPLPRSIELIPSTLRHLIKLTPQREGYLPHLVTNYLRTPLTALHPLNATISSLPLRVRLSSSSFGSFQLTSLLNNAMKQQEAMGASRKDVDDMVTVVGETQGWLLALTFIVSSIHLVLDLFAMKSDVSFWNKVSRPPKSMENASKAKGKVDEANQLLGGTLQDVARNEEDIASCIDKVKHESDQSGSLTNAVESARKEKSLRNSGNMANREDNNTVGNDEVEIDENESEAIGSSGISLGVSFSSICVQLVSETIILLYLWREGASLLVLVPQMGYSLILLWKLYKLGLLSGLKGICLSISFGLFSFFSNICGKKSAPAKLINSRCIDEDLGEEVHRSHNEANETSKYDKEAFKYVGSILFPLIMGYGLFSLFFLTHASWIDWALSTAVTIVYSVGFVLMTPQIYINYKLKSVAHLPMGALFIRFINTIIDDLFTFIIRTPTIHKISVFRDDVTFAILVGQLICYPTRKKKKISQFKEGKRENSSMKKNQEDAGDSECPQEVLLSQKKIN